MPSVRQAAAKVRFVLELRPGGGFRATALGEPLSPSATPLSAEGRDLDDLDRNVTRLARHHFGPACEISILAGLPTRPTDN
jgi:hypothetical protein